MRQIIVSFSYIIDELFKNHLNKGYDNDRTINGFWTNDKLQEEVNKYENRKEFSEKNSKACHIAWSRKIMDKLFKNHPNNGYIDREEWRENSYIIYAYELEEFNKVYVGLTNNIKRRDRDHVFDEREGLWIFCKENDIHYPKYKIIETGLKSTDAQKQEKYWVEFYKNNGWKMFNISTPGSLGGFTVKWTKKSLQREADKYKTRYEFSKNNINAYSSAVRKKLLDELFKNHSNQGMVIKKSGYWTIDQIQKEADKYSTRGEFKEHSASAYQAAKGMLDHIFRNHKNKGYKN